MVSTPSTRRPLNAWAGGACSASASERNSDRRARGAIDSSRPVDDVLVYRDAGSSCTFHAASRRCSSTSMDLGTAHTHCVATSRSAGALGHTGPVGAAAVQLRRVCDAALCGAAGPSRGRTSACSSVRKSTSASGRPGVLFTILAASTQRESAWRPRTRRLLRSRLFLVSARRRLGREFRGGARRVPYQSASRVARDPAPGRVANEGRALPGVPFAATLLRNEGHLDCGYFRHTALTSSGWRERRGEARDHAQWCGEISGRISGGAALFPPVNWTRTTKTKPS